MASLKSPRCITILVLVTVFILGLFTGWSLDGCIKKHQLGSLTNLDEQLNPAMMEAHAVKKLQIKFDLSAEQVEAIRPIVASGIAEVVQLRKDSLRKIVACRSKYLEQIMQHLQPQQQADIRRFMREKDEELQKQLKD